MSNNEIRLNELLNKIYYEYLDSHEAEEFIIYFKRLKQDKDNLQSKIDKAIEYIEKDTRWFDSEYARIYGELCSCEGANSNRLEVMVNPSNLLNILKGDDINE